MWRCFSLYNSFIGVFGLGGCHILRPVIHGPDLKKKLAVNTEDWLRLVCVGCGQGRPPAPRAAHASTTLGSKGYVCGGRVMVRWIWQFPPSLKHIANQWLKVAIENYLFHDRKRGPTMYTVWILRHGHGRKCMLGSTVTFCQTCLFKWC